MKGLNIRAPMPGSDKYVRDLFLGELAAVLLASWEEWRERRVESIRAVDEDHYRDRISLQLSIDRAQVDHAAERAIARAVLDPRIQNPLQAKLFEHKVRTAIARLRKDRVPLLVPALVLPKKLALRFDIEDETSRRLTLVNRFDASALTTHYLVTRKLEALGLTHEEVTPFETILRALSFCIPEGLSHRANFGRRAFRLTRSADQTFSDVQTYLARRVFLSGQAKASLACFEPQLRDLLNLAAEVASQMTCAPTSTIGDLRHPLANPLLLIPDGLKLLRESKPPKEGELTCWMITNVKTLLDECKVLLELLKRLSQPEASSSEGQVLQALMRFSDFWVAYLPLRVRTGETFLVKITQTIPIGATRDVPWYRRGGVWVRRQLPPITAVSHRYKILIGDARSTHVEVVSPDPSAVSLRSKSTGLEYGLHRSKRSKGVRKLFGMAYLESRDVLSLYTTKDSQELKELMDAPASRWGAVRRWLGRPSPRPSPGVVGLRIAYRPQLTVGSLYVLVGCFAVFVAWTLWRVWSRLPGTPPTWLRWLLPPYTGQGARNISTLGQSLIALFGLLVGVLAARERTSLAARALTIPRKLLFLSTALLLSGLALALYKGQFG